MKFSNHFIDDVLPKRPYLTEEILSEILNNPISQVIQADGRKKIWGYSSIYQKYIRIVILEDGITIHSAFFDRNSKEQTKR